MPNPNSGRNELGGENRDAAENGSVTHYLKKIYQGDGMASFMSGESSASQVAADNRISVLFVGSSLHYSTETLNSVQFEFGVSAFRSDAVDMYSPVEGVDFAAPRLLVVDQRLAEDLLARPDVYRQVARDGCIAFAYRREDAARNFLRRWNRTDHGDIGFLPTNVPVEVWRSTLRLLLHHQLYVPAALMQVAQSATPILPTCLSDVKVSPRENPRQSVFHRLTKREKQVLKLVAQGESNKAVAGHLGITEHTVKLHMHNLVNKIGVPNRTAAASFYFEVSGQSHGRG